MKAPFQWDNIVLPVSLDDLLILVLIIGQMEWERGEKIMNRELKRNFRPVLLSGEKKSLKPPGFLSGEGGCSVYEFSQIGINKSSFSLVNCLRVQAWRWHSVIALFRVALRFSAFLFIITFMSRKWERWNWALESATLWPLAHVKLEHCTFPVDIQSSLLCTLCRNLA